MKPSQRIYQQRDIADHKMQRAAWFVAKFLRSGDKGDLVKRHLEEFTKWETIRNVLTTQGDIASGEEYKERKKRLAKHDAEKRTKAEAALIEAVESLEEEVGEVMAKVLTQDNLVSDVWNKKLNELLNGFNSTTTNTVTLNTSFPLTATSGQSLTFTIPRFKVPPVEEDVEGFV